MTTTTSATTIITYPKHCKACSKNVSGSERFYTLHFSLNKNLSTGKSDNRGNEKTWTGQGEHHTTPRHDVQCIHAPLRTVNHWCIDFSAEEAFKGLRG